jgi:hypothetical protein
MAALEIRRPLLIDPRGTIPFLMACAPLAAISFFYARVRPRENLTVVGTALLQILMFSAIGCVVQYLLARDSGDFWSATLLAWDKWLGLDWRAMAQGVSDRPVLARLLGVAYNALIPEAVLVVVLLGWREQLDEVRTFILAGMICGATCILLSHLIPAVDCNVYLGLSQARLPNLDFNVSYAAAKELAALRSGQLNVIELPSMQGLVTFPSYHAGLATASCWASLKIKSRKIGYFGAVMAIATIISAPVRGGHYFVDVFAGIAIGMVSLVAATRLVYWPGIRWPLTAWPFRRSRAAFAR